MKAKDKLAAARADHGSIDEHAEDLDTTALRKQSLAKVGRLKAEHDDAEGAVAVELEDEPDRCAIIHHGRRDVGMSIDEDDDRLVVGDLDEDEDDDED